MEKSSPNRSSIFRAPLEEVPEAPIVEKYLDSEGLKNEYRDLRTHKDNWLNNIRTFGALPDSRSYETWKRLQAKMEQIFTTGRSIREEILSSPIGKTTVAINLAFLLDTAISVLIQRALQKQRTIAQESSTFSSYFEPFMQTTQFALTGQLDIKVAGISLGEMLSKSDLPLSSIYRFLIETSLIKFSMRHEEVLAQNKNPLAVTYPNVAKKNINEVSGQVIALNGNESSVIETFSRHFTAPTDKEIVSEMAEITRKASELRQKLATTILHPDSPQFASLKAAIEEYLSKEDNRTRTLAIAYLGLSDSKNIPIVYRRARQLAQTDGINSEFYKNLADSIREFVEEIPSSFPIFTSDDLYPIIDTDKNHVDKPQVPTFEDLRKTTSAINQLSSKKEYHLEPQEIDWGFFIPPTTVELKFSESGVRKFILKLHYRNEEGEVLDFDFAFNLNKDHLDWQFIEDPNDPEMKDIKNAVLQASSSVLNYIQESTQVAYDQRKRSKTSLPFTPVATNGKNKDTKPRVPRERETTEKPQRPLTPIQEALVNPSTMSTHTSERTKKHIILPPEEVIRDMLQGISMENQNKIVEAIQKFNERGGGKFKPLTFIEHEGKSVFEVRVGNFRVLVTQANGENGHLKGIQKFVIQEIGDRKEIFRRKTNKL